MIEKDCFCFKPRRKQQHGHQPGHQKHCDALQHLRDTTNHRGLPPANQRRAAHGHQKSTNAERAAGGAVPGPGPLRPLPRLTLCQQPVERQMAVLRCHGAPAAVAPGQR